MKESRITKIGLTASILSMAMYASYIDLIRLNLEGHKGSFILPVVTTINCIFWVLYGAFKPKKDWPIILCNAVGLFFGLLVIITVLL